MWSGLASGRDSWRNIFQTQQAGQRGRVPRTAAGRYDSAGVREQI